MKIALCFSIALFVSSTVVRADDSSDFTALAAGQGNPSATENSTTAVAQDSTGRPDNTWSTLGRYAGPILLGVSALGVVALGIHALLPPTCAFRAGDGLCLRGEDANVQAGAALLVSAGVLALGAVLWMFIIDAPAQETTRVVTNECGPWSLCASF